MKQRKSPIITLIAGMSANYVIGDDNKLPWNQPKDLKHFKKCTQGKPIVMGRKTFESIGRPLPDRVNIVITRDKDFKAEGVEVVNSLGDGINAAGDVDEVMVIGGEMIYNQCIKFADELELTILHKEIKGDAHFPEFITLDDWVVKRMEFSAPDAANPIPMTFMRFERAFKE